MMAWMVVGEEEVGSQKAEGVGVRRLFLGPQPSFAAAGSIVHLCKVLV